MGGPDMRRIHMIGNAHIDPVWLWQWPEGYQEVRATFRSAVDRMDEYPDFVFTCDSSLFFEWVEESDPELFERLRAHIADGRLQVEAVAGDAGGRGSCQECGDSLEGDGPQKRGRGGTPNPQHSTVSARRSRFK